MIFFCFPKTQSNASDLLLSSDMPINPSIQPSKLDPEAYSFGCIQSMIFFKKIQQFRIALAAAMVPYKVLIFHPNKINPSHLRLNCVQVL